MTINNLFLCLLLLFVGCNTKKETPTEASLHEEGESTVAEVQSEPATASDISVQELQEMLQGGELPILLDVRTPEEIASGVIQQDVVHININGDQFEEQVAQLDPDETYVVYCKAGGRSSRAQEYMLAQGFKHVINMTGGITAWDSAGYYKVVPSN